jgi:hypothetical protein
MNYHEVIWIFVSLQGFVSFCLLSSKLDVVSVELVSTCAGSACRGLYGDRGCSCVTVSRNARRAVKLLLSLADDGEYEGHELFDVERARLQPYTCTKLTEELVGCDTVQVCDTVCYCLLKQ